MAQLEEIYVRDLESDEEATILIDEVGNVTIPDDTFDNEFNGPLPLRLPGLSSDEVLSTRTIMVEPTDPRYALALQEALPDGVMVEGAKVGGKRLAWDALILLGQRKG